MHALTVIPFADLMPAQVAPVCTYTAFLFLADRPYSMDLPDEAAFLDIADSLDACVIELYECGSMVLRQCAPLPDVVPGVYPLELAA